MGKTYEIVPMVLGHITIDKSFMTYFMDCGTRIRLPIVSFYIKGADRNILVDTGCTASLLEKYNQGYARDDVQSFEEALGKQGLKPEDIDMVIQTHMHLDHNGNTQQCTNAEVILQEEELKFARSPHPLWASIFPEELLEGVNFKTVKGDTKIADGIELLFAPGHTPGTQSVAVETAKGKAVITGFCCIEENFNAPKEITDLYPTWVVFTPGFHCDALASYDSIMRIKKLADIVVPSHEPALETMERIP
jgi:glyoxylase-like metal-dependent hydrolase (beta-lactamase superfamily II)